MREKAIADLYDCNNIFLIGRSQTVNFMTAVGKNITFFQKVMMAYVFQMDFTLEDIDNIKRPDDNESGIP